MPLQLIFLMMHACFQLICHMLHACCSLSVLCFVFVVAELNIELCAQVCECGLSLVASRWLRRPSFPLPDLGVTKCEACPCDHLCFRHAGFCTMLCSRHQANCSMHQGYEAHTAGVPVTASKLQELFNELVPHWAIQHVSDCTDSIFMYWVTVV